MIRKAIFLTQEAFRTIGRHKLMTTISVVIMSLSLLMFAVFLLATDNLLRFVGEAQHEMKVYVYLDDALDPQGVEQIHHRILAMDDVDQVVFISREEALDDFRSDLGDDADLLDALDANPLPNSLWVTPTTADKTPEAMAALAGRIGELPGVDEVRYGEEFMSRFDRIIKGVYFVDLIVGLIVIISAMFIISNAVRLTVLSRRKNIEVFKLVGATNRFISMPFVLEGAFQGGFAAMVSLLLLVVLTMLTQRVLPDVAFLSADKAALYVVTCVAMGSIGSVMALRKFLKV